MGKNTFQERERKFSLADKTGIQMPDVWSSIIHDDSYLSPGQVRLKRQNVPLDQKRLVTSPEHITDWRLREYFYDPDLVAHGRAEIRRENDVVMVKIGNGADADHPTLDRYEEQVKQAGLHELSFDKAGKKLQTQLCKIFEQSSIRAVEESLRALIRIDSQRRKKLYLRDWTTETLDLNVHLEIAWDQGVGRTFVNQHWPIDEIEIEVKKIFDSTSGRDVLARHKEFGFKKPDMKDLADQILSFESERLRARFSLEEVVHSKPAPGVDLMRPVLERHEGRQAAGHNKTHFHVHYGLTQ